MKGQEFVTQLAREDMPDPAQVRARAHRQAAPERPRVRRLSLAAVFLALSLAFAGVVYAVAPFVLDRFDPGGMVELIFVPYDDPDYWDMAVSVRSTVPVFQSPNVRPLYRFIFFYDHVRTFPPDWTAEINAMLAGQLFTADGSPFPYDLISRPSYFYHQERRIYSDSFRVDTRGHDLFNYLGEEIGSIRAVMQYERFTDVEILTLSEYNQRLGYIHTAEEVIAVLGAPFRLPTVHLHHFSEPLFHITPQNWVHILFLSPDRWRHEALLITIEPLRDTDTAPIVHYIPGGAVQRFYATTTPVYKVTGFTHATQFIWENDGLLYRLIPPTRLLGEFLFGGEFVYYFTHDEILAIIGSMVR